jgi:hypothetical protein
VARNLDSSLATALSSKLIQPVIFCQIAFQSGTEYLWSGVGDFVWNTQTWKGLGKFAQIGEITESSAVQADGTSVTLSGIGLSSMDIPPLGVTPPSPPRSTVAGESMAWSLATVPPVPNAVTIGPSIWNGFLGCSGSASGDITSGSLSLTGGDVFAVPTVALDWSGFQIPPEIPVGATITDVIPVVDVSTGGAGVISSSLPENLPSPSAGTHYLSDLATLSGARISASIASSLPGMPTETLIIPFVGIAVYYLGSPLPKASLIYEALNDIRIGGPVKIWFGLMSGGALIGTPYLVFRGMVDKPTVKTSPETSKITLQLENRMVNLQRANQRRYTAADQQIDYPDDSGFNWVEILNDIALRWGN